MELNNENNLIKFEGKSDFSHVSEEIYHDAGKTMAKELGQAGTTVVGLLNNTIGVPFELYNAWARPKIDKLKEKIESKMLDIPSDKLTTPPMNVVGSAMEGLKYNLDEEDLKEMFTNLIANSCNVDYQSQIHPIFAQILKSLSGKDATFLKKIKNNNNSFYSIQLLVEENNGSGHYDMTKYAMADYLKKGSNVGYNVFPLDEMVLDNLQREQLIKVTYDEWFTEQEEQYTALFDNAKSKYKVKANQTLNYKKGIVNLTRLGESFVNVCIN